MPSEANDFSITRVTHSGEPTGQPTAQQPHSMALDDAQPGLTAQILDGGVAEVIPVWTPPAT